MNFKNNFFLSKKITKITFVLFLCVGVSKLIAQPLPPISNFYTPNVNSSNVRNLNPGAGLDTRRMQDQIDALSNSGGGILRVNQGRYQLRNVVLKSNVHIEVDHRVVFEATRPGNIFMATSNQRISNFSIISRDRATGRSGIRRFRVDLTALNPGDGLRVVNFNNAENFRMADFEIQDNLTRFACFAFLPGNTNNSNSFFDNNQPRATTTSRGIVENSNVDNATPGWGLVQVQAADNILFRNISGTGGVTLRLESGLDALARLNEANRARTQMDRIFARNVSVTNGRSAVFLSPHTIVQGFVDVRGITAVSSEFAVFLARGFRSIGTSSRTDQTGLPLGTFSPAPIVRNINATFGEDAQLRSQEFRYLPCALRRGRRVRNGVLSGVASSNIPGTSNFRVGPSVAPVLNLADGDDQSEGSYRIRLGSITSSGYRSDVVDEITGNNNDFEDCAQSVNFGFVPRAARNTPNPLNPRESSSSKLLSANNIEANNVSLSPNPASSIVNVVNTENNEINVYSLTGTLVKTISGVAFDGTMNVSDLATGLYLVQIGSKTIKLSVSR